MLIYLLQFSYLGRLTFHLKKGLNMMSLENFTVVEIEIRDI